MDSDCQKNVMSETHGKNGSCSASRTASALDSLTQSFTFLLYSSSSIGLLVFVVFHQSVNENLVPALIFTTHPYLFHAFVIAVMVSFATASGGLLIANNPRHAKICRWYFRISQISLALALLLMAFALFLEFLRLVSSGFRLWVDEEEVDSFFVYKYVFQVYRKICPATEENSEVS